jgi:hypothetical protein
VPAHPLGLYVLAHDGLLGGGALVAEFRP